MGIRSRVEQQQHIRDAMVQALTIVNVDFKTSQVDSLLTLSDVGPLQDTIRGGFNPRQAEVLAAELFLIEKSCLLRRRWIVDCIIKISLEIAIFTVSLMR